MALIVMLAAPFLMKSMLGSASLRAANASRDAAGVILTLAHATTVVALILGVAARTARSLIVEKQEEPLALYPGGRRGLAAYDLWGEVAATGLWLLFFFYLFYGALIYGLATQPLLVLAMHLLAHFLVQAALGALEQALESRLFGELAERIDSATEAVGRVLQDEVRTEIEDWIHLESQTVPPGLTATYERMLEVTVADTVERFTVSAVPSAAVAVGAGAGSTVAVAVLAKALAKKIMASAAVKTVGKVGGGIWGRLGGAAGGAAIGFFLGPVGAVVGGVAGGAAAWLAFDGAVVNIDERLHRGDLERELTALVDEHKARVKSVTSTAVDEVKLEALGEVTPSELSNRD